MSNVRRTTGRRSLHRLVRSHYARRGADATSELLFAQFAVGKCRRTTMELSPIKRPIGGNVIWAPLLALDATVVAVMDQFCA